MSVPSSSRIPAVESKVTILLAGDSSLELQTLRIMLEAGGFHVLSAGEDGDVSLILRRSLSPIDLLLIGAERDGANLALEIGRIYPHLPVLLISGQDLPASANSEFSYFKRPVRPLIIVQTVRAMLGLNEPRSSAQGMA